MGTPATAQGRETRERILDAAAELIAEHGADGTSLDDVRAATRTSKSQLYHYFGDKQGLVHAVTDRQCERVIALHAELLGEVRDWAGLRAWADAIVATMEAQAFRGGCPLGTLAAALADTDETARERLASAFAAWREAITAALGRLVENGQLDPAADLDALDDRDARRRARRSAARQDRTRQQAAPDRARHRHPATARAHPAAADSIPLTHETLILSAASTNRYSRRCQPRNRGCTDTRAAGPGDRLVCRLPRGCENRAHRWRQCREA